MDSRKNNCQIIKTEVISVAIDVIVNWAQISFPKILRYCKSCYCYILSPLSVHVTRQRPDNTFVNNNTLYIQRYYYKAFLITKLLHKVIMENDEKHDTAQVVLEK